VNAIVNRTPATKSAILPNAFDGRPTLHVFERAEIQPVFPGEKEEGVALLYRCTRTGELRRWGCEEIR
jgi:hypothetical protein